MKFLNETTVANGSDQGRVVIAAIDQDEEAYAIEIEGSGKCKCGCNPAISVNAHRTSIVLQHFVSFITIDVLFQELIFRSFRTLFTSVVSLYWLPLPVLRDPRRAVEERSKYPSSRIHPPYHKWTSST